MLNPYLSLSFSISESSTEVFFQLRAGDFPEISPPFSQAFPQIHLAVGAKDLGFLHSTGGTQTSAGGSEEGVVLPADAMEMAVG